MEIELKAKSSSPGSSYSVVFRLIEGKLSASCNCQAGENGQNCKHKWQLLHGDESMLLDLSQKNQLKQIAEIAKGKNIDSLNDKIESLKNESKKFEKAQKKASADLREKTSRRMALKFEEYEDLCADLDACNHAVDYQKYLIKREKKIIDKMIREGF